MIVTIQYCLQAVHSRADQLLQWNVFPQCRLLYTDILCYYVYTSGPRVLHSYILYCIFVLRKMKLT